MSIGYFDHATREALLDEVLFDALVATHRGVQGHPSLAGRLVAQQEQLRELGVMVGTEVHASLRDGLSAIVGAHAVLHLRVSTPHFSGFTRAWLLASVTGMAQYGELVGLREIPTALLIDHVADHLRLGPRAQPRSTAPLRITRRVIDALLAGQEENRDAAATLIADRLDPALGPVSADLLAGRWQTWHAELTWLGLDRARDGRALIAIDTPSGFLAASPVDERLIELALVRPEEIWRRLLRLMPPTEVLAADHRAP